MRELGNVKKQKIRDEIDRLEHLKEPYIIWIQILISTCLVFFIFMLGGIDSQLDKLKITNNYTIELFENSTINATPKIYGAATPNEGFDSRVFKRILNNLFVILFLSVLFILALILYVVKYVRFDQKINELYNIITEAKTARIVKKPLLTSFFNKEVIKKDKQDLESFFNKYQYTLLVLSIFLLITVEFVGKIGYLNNLMALLSSLIAYFLLIGIEMPLDKDRQTIPLFGFSIIFPVFIVTFCAWTILNIVISLDGEKSKTIWIAVWLVLMLYPVIKSLFKKDDSP